MQARMQCEAHANSLLHLYAERGWARGCAGTTSKPKGVPLTHANLAASLANIRDTYELKPTDRSLLVMPLFHVHGLMAGRATLVRNEVTMENMLCCFLERPLVNRDHQAPTLPRIHGVGVPGMILHAAK